VRRGGGPPPGAGRCWRSGRHRGQVSAGARSPGPGTAAGSTGPGMRCRDAARRRSPAPLPGPARPEPLPQLPVSPGRDRSTPPAQAGAAMPPLARIARRSRPVPTRPSSRAAEPVRDRDRPEARGSSPGPCRRAPPAMPANRASPPRLARTASRWQPVRCPQAASATASRDRGATIRSATGAGRPAGGAGVRPADGRAGRDRTAGPVPPQGAQGSTRHPGRAGRRDTGLRSKPETQVQPGRGQAARKPAQPPARPARRTRRPRRRGERGRSLPRSCQRSCGFYRETGDSRARWPGGLGRCRPVPNRG